MEQQRSGNKWIIDTFLPQNKNYYSVVFSGSLANMLALILSGRIARTWMQVDVQKY